MTNSSKTNKEAINELDLSSRHPKADLLETIGPIIDKILGKQSEVVTRSLVKQPLASVT